MKQLLRQSPKIIIFLLGSFLFQTPSYAALDLVLTQGVSTGIPIAIVPFSGQNGLDNDTVISTVVNTDLQNSGQFNVLDSASMTQSPHTAADIDNDFWQKNAAVNDVVVGTVQPLGGDRYQVNVALQDVVNHQTLLNKNYTVNESQLRALAHHISDAIYQQLTGVKGIFSTQIAYIAVQRTSPRSAKYSLIVADQDGYNAHVMLISPQPIMSPTWSHSGKEIAYVSFEHVTPQIFVQNIGSGARRVVSQFPGVNGAPAWSPDDTKLAMALSKNGSLKIYTMTLSTGQLRQLTQGSSMDTEPSWSPDGKTLLFTSDRSGGPQIFSLNLASGAIQRLTYQGSYNARGSFTPDGSEIVMINRQNDKYNIASQDLKNNTLQILTSSGYDASPSVAPNGKMVLYESGKGDQNVLGMVSMDGRVHLRLPSQEGSVQDPAWSPFIG